MITRSPIWRATLVLVVALVAAVSLALPAGTAGKFLTKKKALKLFYTKTQADSKFIDTTEKAADSDQLDGTDLTALATKLDNVVTVSQSGGDFTSVQAAIDSITDASSSNRYLVLVGPGTYAGRVTLKSGITVAGSGVAATVLTADAAVSCIDGFVVKGASGASVTNLTISASGSSGACAVGILNAGGSPIYRNLFIISHTTQNTTGMLNDSAGVELLHVDMSIGQGSGSGDAIGIDQQNGATLIATDVRVVGCTSADDIYGLQNNDSSAFLTEVDLSVFKCTGTGDAIGILNTSGSADIVRADGSVVSGTTASIDTSAGYTTQVGASKLGGGPVSGTVTCAQVYDEAFVVAESTCP